MNVTGVMGVKLAPAAPTDPWDALVALLAAALPPEPHRLILALDEIPWWLDALEGDAPGSARTALAHLRRIRHDPRFSRVRWILTGSVGLEARAIDWGASAELNDLDPVVVPPLDAEAGATLFEIECPETTPEAARLAHGEAGGLPHWIRVLAARCHAAGHAAVRPEHVLEEVERLVQPTSRHLFQEEGLGHLGRRYEPDEHAIARDLLDVVGEYAEASSVRGVVTAVQARGEGRTSEQVERVLWRLVDEFYLAATREEVAFVVPLFRRWWQRWGRR